MQNAEAFSALEAQIIAWRRWFHRFPELSLNEHQTSAKIRQELEQMGLLVTPLSPGTGLCAVLNGSAPGPTIALRADMDALPIKEQTSLSFSSENEGLMHACGHDGHIAMLLGAAQALTKQKDALSGRVVFLFQAAEEISQGHQEAIAFLDSIGGVDALLGLHLWSTLPEGEILLIPGAVFAGGGNFEITLKGQGGHGARPDLVRDPIKAACELVLKLAAIPANYYDVLDPAVCTTCQIQAGTASNIFPEQAVIKGTYRWFKPEGGERIEALLRRFTQAVALSHQVEAAIELGLALPPVMNDPALVKRARELVPKVPGLTLSPQTEPISASDNMACLLARWPGFYGILGAGGPEGSAFPHHHAQFDLKEEALIKGARLMTAFVTDFLSGKSPL